MEIGHFHGRRGCGELSALVLAFLAPFLGAQSVGLETPEEARAFLRALVRSEEGEQRVAVALEALDSDDYPERMRATRALLLEPSLSEDLVEQARREGSTDLRFRLDQILKFQTPERVRGRLAETLRAISTAEWKAFAPDVLAALEGQADPEGVMWQAAMAAMRATVLPADRPVLVAALGSPSVLARGAGVVGLIEISGAEAVEEIAALASDPEPLVLLLVADFLRGLEDRRCVPVYVSLLEADDFSIRWQASQALRAMTGKTFGYDAGAEGAKRWIALLSWRSWLKGEGLVAELSFDEEVEQAVILFDGRSLAGWHEVGREAGAGWEAAEGVLACTGIRNAGGFLRTEGAYADYRLSLEYRLPDGAGDSGIGLFMAKGDVATPDCLEVQVLTGKTGDLYRIGSFEAKDGEGRPIQFQKAREGDAVEHRGDWNQVECVVMGGTLEVRLNGTVVNRATDCPKTEGRINLRNEGNRVEFRKLVLTPIRP